MNYAWDQNSLESVIILELITVWVSCGKIRQVRYWSDDETLHLFSTSLSAFDTFLGCDCSQSPFDRSGVFSGRERCHQRCQDRVGASCSGHIRGEMSPRQTFHRDMFHIRNKHYKLHLHSVNVLEYSIYTYAGILESKQSKQHRSFCLNTPSMLTK